MRLLRPHSSTARSAGPPGFVRVSGLIAICLMAAACSGGGKHANSPRTSTPTVTAAPVASLFGACPASAPTRVPAAQSATPGLAEKLVPITPTSIRVCQYDAQNLLAASGEVTSTRNFAKVVTQTNALTKGAPTPGCPAITAPRFFVSFAAKTAAKVTRVDIAEVGDCGFVTNGKYVAIGKLTWRTTLAKAGLTISEDHSVALPVGSTAAPSGGAHLRGTLSSDSRCFWVVDSSDRRTDVIWPAGYTGRAHPLRVVDKTGRVIGTVGAAIDIGGGLVNVSAKVRGGVAENTRLCLPPANCKGDTCGIWIAA